MSTDPIKQAAEITKAYAEDWDRLTQGECKEAGFSDAQCDTLRTSLGTASQGFITDEEKSRLEEMGFAKDFIQNLAGDDGNKALQSRVRWLADRINPKKFIICWRNCDARERSNGVLELSRIGLDAAPATSALIKAIEDEDANVRIRAVQTLGDIRLVPVSALPPLIHVLKDENADVRSEAAHALGQIGFESAIPALTEAMKEDENRNVRYSAAIALSRINPAAAVPAVPELIEALKYNQGMCYFTAEALGKIGDPHAIPPLQKMIRDDPDAHCRQVAQEALDQLMEKFR